MSVLRKQRFSLVVLLAGVAVLCVGTLLFSEPSTPTRSVPLREPTLTSGEESTPLRKLRIATYNLRNFNNSNRIGDDGKFKYNAPKSEKSKRAVYRTILTVRPDILSVQEIGGNAWLNELADSLARDGLVFPYRVVLNGYDEYHKLAILSRIPFSKTIEIQAREKLTRGLLGGVVSLPNGKSLYVYNVHLKSKRSSNPDDPESAKRRLAEARYIRRLVEFGVTDEKTAEKIPASLRFPVPARLKKNGAEFFVLTGDFNDVPASKALGPLEAQKFAQGLDARDSNGGIFTFFNPNRGYFHTFDRIFVSPEIFEKYYIPTSAKIADFPWAQSASDHRLVYADFDFE